MPQNGVLRAQQNTALTVGINHPWHE
ncbi:MAG: hypothetical protein ACI9K5_001411, partial [Gammaproteobacteria bacterium]